MRRFGWVLTATTLVAVSGATSALAEMDIKSPAEVPPASFKGRQYVDSAGCVFVRAGYGTTVNWVPRVARDKTHLCGYKPTFQNGEKVLDVAKVAPAPVPQPAPAAAPAPIPAPKASAKPAVAEVPMAPPSSPRMTAKVLAPSPFAPTPLVGRPMATIAQIDTPPTIGLAQAQPRPATMSAPTQPPAAQTTAATVGASAASRAAYVSPYVSGYTPSASSSAVRYHNVTPVPAPTAVSAAVSTAGSAAVPASKSPAATAPTIVAGMAVPPASTACPPGTDVAQRYTLSDGRSVVRCGGAAPDPVAFINAAEVTGLVVATSSASMGTQSGYVSPYVSDKMAQNRPGPTAPMMAGTSYAATAYAPAAYSPTAYVPTAYAPTAATMAYEAAPTAPPPAPPTAPMVAGTGYAVSGGLTPQQAYVSPYQSSARTSAPPAVIVRASSGQTTLAPVLVGSKSGDAANGAYATAFDDGRLNPFRGPRSLMGDAEQGVMWSNQVPARLVGAKTPQAQRIVPQATLQPAVPQPAVRVSSKATPAAATRQVQPQQPQAAAAPRYVQVGSFAVPGNAAAVKARLAAAGLPVSSATTARGLTIVYAGPFADARGALGTVRAAGFADVLLR